MNSSNSNYFWKIIFTNECSMVKVQGKSSIKEYIIYFPLQTLNFWFNVPVTSFWYIFNHWKSQWKPLFRVCCFLNGFKCGIRIWWIWQFFLRMHLYWITKHQGQKHWWGKCEEVWGKEVKNSLCDLIKASCFHDANGKLWQASVPSWSLSC